MTTHEQKSLYVCKDYHILIFESKALAETVIDLSIVARPPVDKAALSKETIQKQADYWAKETKSRVIYAKRYEPIFLIANEDGLEPDCEYWNVIIGEKIGWIVVKHWMEIDELENE